jgi:hypothetical protein
MALSEILITKASGEQVVFEESKLRNSLTKAGANEEAIARILYDIESQLYNGMSSKKIYQIAFGMLKKHSRPTAARYKLKHAIMELGPTGYPFEQFIGEVFRDQGFRVQVGVVEQGHCVTHEVDVLGEKDNRRIAVECKYGNRADKKVDVRVPLYIHSRFRDLSQEWRKSLHHKEKQYEGWIVTNTSFTEDAIRYGTCAGLHLIAWDFPKKGNLKDMIDYCHLHPVTSMTSLTQKEKQGLMDRGIVLCRDIIGNEKALEEVMVPRGRIRQILNEAIGLCG